MTEEELRKFDKDTLVKFIFEDSIFRRDEVLASLKRFERDLRFEKLMAQSKALNEQMRQTEGFENFKRWNFLRKKHEKVQKEIYKMLDNY